MLASVLSFVLSLFRSDVTHYVRMDMNNLTFTKEEYEKLVIQGENLSKFIPATKIAKNIYKTKHGLYVV